MRKPRRKELVKQKSGSAEASVGPRGRFRVRRTTKFPDLFELIYKNDFEDDFGEDLTGLCVGSPAQYMIIANHIRR